MIDEDYEDLKFTKAEIWYIVKWALIISAGFLGLFIVGVELFKRYS